MSNLQAKKMVKQSQQVCKPLTEEEYAKAFVTFIKGSTEYREIRVLAKPIIDRFGDKSIDLMSIGAGTGCIEDDFIKELGLKLEYFHAIEPNKDHLETLQKTVSLWGNVEMTIDPRYFTEDYQTDRKFDMILMSHSMYCMDNPIPVIIKAISCLKPMGALVIFSQTEIGGYELYAHMKEHVDMARPINDHFVTSASISEALYNNAIKHDLQVGPSQLDVTDFIDKRGTPTANHVITFLLQTDYAVLAEDLQKRIYEMVKARVTTDANGKHMFNHPSGMVVVRRE